jgi:ABC-type bacteriocin/lantibiotic exporter with double-glycine peptidase domain
VFKTWYEATIKIDLPSVKQTKSYSCGAGVFRSIAKHYGIEICEKDLIKLLKTSYEEGTDPTDLKKIVQTIGLNIKEHHNMSIGLLKKYLNEKKPVICAIQAYGKPKDYKKDKNGHYVIAIGYDKNYIYFEDPVLKGRRGHLKNDEFLKRWHDYDEGRKFKCYGLVVWKDKKISTQKIDKSVKIE